MRPDASTSPPRPAWGPVLLVSTVVAATLLALAGRYGPHRDELYFLAAGHRLAWGYPDQPPLTPLLARLADALAPGSLFALRAPSALAAAGTVVLAGLAARELGGGRAAQALAALATACGAVVLVTGHLLSTATFDLLAWTAVTVLALRALLRDAPRTWLAVGGVAGLALLNKNLVLALLAGLVVGVVLTPAARHHLRSPWAWGGAALALVLWAPNLLWQATSGWPQLALAEDINAEYGVLGERLGYLAFQLIQFSPLAVPLWVAGLVGLWRGRQGWAATRPLAWAYGLLFVGFLVVGGKGYYLGGLYPALLAAGSVLVTQHWAERPRLLAAVPVALVLGILPALPSALPLLPPDRFAGSIWHTLGEDQAETIGWPSFIDTVASAAASVPVDQRDTMVVLTANYGEAGAVEWYGAGRDLPTVYSGHNGFGLWGPPPSGAGPVILFGFRDPPQNAFTGCRRAGVVDTGLDNEEDGRPVWLCDEPARSWAQLWPDLLHLDA